MYEPRRAGGSAVEQVHLRPQVEQVFRGGRAGQPQQPVDRQLAVRRAATAGRMRSANRGDNGSGIQPQNRTLIFEKFSRLNDPSRAGGAGLGLAICQEIMQFLGGSIAYLPGRGGACFRIALPKRPPAPPESGSLQNGTNLPG